MKLLRMAFVVACAALLAASLRFESHEVSPLAEKGKAADERSAEAVDRLDGLAFTEAATVDGFLRTEGRLYDVYSLTPFSSESGLSLDVEKKCPT